LEIENYLKNCDIIFFMKKILGNKTAIILLAALILGFGGTFGYLALTTKTQKEEKKEETKNEPTVEQKSDKGELPPPDTTEKKPAPVQEKAPTSDSTSLAVLNSSVTAQKNTSDNSIDILFYLEGSGTFTSQEKSGSSWVTVKENQIYGGRGGFQAGSIPAGQDVKTIRVLKIENGKYTAVTKEFTIKRSEVESALGIKTYN